MPAVIPIPTDPTIALAAPDVPEDFASALRGNINVSKDAVDAKVMLTAANLETLHAAIGFAHLSGGTITVGTGLSVNVASLSAFVGTYVEYSGSQVVGGLEDNQTNYIFLRQDTTWTIPPGGSSTVPSSGDGHGAALLWGTATTVSGGVTGVTNTRVTFPEALAAAAGALTKSANLADVDSVSDSRDNLGLGTAAVADTGDFDAAGDAAAAVAAHLAAFVHGNIPLSGSGTPESAVTATIGKLYLDTTNGALWQKVTGTGNTGWSNIFGGISPAPATASATAGAATANSKRCMITSEALTTAGLADYTLTLTNSFVSTNSIVLVSVGFGTNTTEGVSVQRITPGSGSVVILLRNTNAITALNGTLVISVLVS